MTEKRLDGLIFKRRVKNAILFIGLVYGISLIILEVGLRLLGMFPMAVATGS